MNLIHEIPAKTEANMESPYFSQGRLVRDSSTKTSSKLSLQKLNDDHLIHQTDTLVHEERELLTTLLHHFREIDHRRLYSSYGYKSLFEMAVKRFGYSEDQAYRRISAMRLLKEIPEIEEKITSGELTLTNLSLAQSFFRQQKKTAFIAAKDNCLQATATMALNSRDFALEGSSGMTEALSVPNPAKINAEFLGRPNSFATKEEKLLLLNQLSKKSSREAQKITCSYSNGQAIKPDQVRSIDERLVELKFIASREVLEEIEKIKGLLAHRSPNMSLGEVLNFLCETALRDLDPSKTKKQKKSSRSEIQINLASEVQIKSASETEISSASEIQKMSGSEPQKESGSSIKSSPTTAASKKTCVTKQKTNPTSQAQMRRDVYARAKNQCESCWSRHALQVDHIQPRALGGADTPENLRLLCRSCNQRAAIKIFGRARMSQYLP